VWVFDRAREQLDPSLDTTGIKVSGEAVTSTSILETSVIGGDPDADAPATACSTALDDLCPTTASFTDTP
jgi:hypothetical protein